MSKNSILGQDRAQVEKSTPYPCPRCTTLTRHHCKECGVRCCALCLTAKDECPECVR